MGLEDFIPERDWNFINDDRWNQIQKEKDNLNKMVTTEPSTASLTSAIEAFATLMAILG